MSGKIKDLTDIRFNNLTVMRFDHRDKYTYWLCKCDCGNEVVVRGSHLTTGAVKSCGCLKNSKHKIRNLDGKRFGKLTVIKYHHINHGAYYLCKCDCGNEVIVLGTKLVTGRTKSCGCLITEHNHKNREDLTNKRFGKLTVMFYNEIIKKMAL